ncbi:MAG: hypothetical protein GX591_05490 [Planctomycetes bacterium]|nr:hypothetical protein [Planctomycetota bacterium]
MTLELIPIPSDTPPPDRRIVALLDEADRRIEAFLGERQNRSTGGFVPSDFDAVYRVLRWIEDGHLATGTAFLEWGSGLGVVTCLAATLGWDACGIEIQGDLVEQAERLAEAFDLPATFVHGTFIPTGDDDVGDTLAASAWLQMGGSDAYEDLGLDIEDFDVIFAYPWPGEHHVVETLFDRHAAVGALLLTYHGLEGLMLRRKAGGRMRR